MTEKEAGLKAFADRLNSSLDAIHFAASGEGRQDALAKYMGVSQKGARKWLVGESYPVEDKRNRLAALCKVRYEWLMTGNGERYADDRTLRSQAENIETRVSDSLIRIPVMNVECSQGCGRYPPDYETMMDEICISETWLRHNALFSSPSNLSIIVGVGDSMKPTYQDGDLLLVDRGITEIKVDAVYVFRLHDAMYVKRLQSRPDGALLMISDNKAYEPFVVTIENRAELKILARILFALNVNRL
jgi:phage repressor protein C with HTH and peptisase S24 domain